jgi:hypothetical protein
MADYFSPIAGRGEFPVARQSAAASMAEPPLMECVVG